jgi:hypothetical protein
VPLTAYGPVVPVSITTVNGDAAPAGADPAVVPLLLLHAATAVATATAPASSAGMRLARVLR